MFFAVLFFYQGLVFNVATSLICMIAVFEFLHTTKYLRHSYLIGVSMGFAALVPFSNLGWLQDKLYIMVFLLFVLYGVALFRHHPRIKFEQLAVGLMGTLLIPFSFSTLVFIRDYALDATFYYLILVFATAWVTDGGAYFTGRAVGKHKLASEISPQKTIEGAVGGVLICVAVTLLYTYLYILVMQTLGYQVAANFVNLGWTVVIAAVLGICGDLFASVIKRQTKIKDFGKLMPGHGGVLDRFDSVLLIAPFVYIVMQFFTLVTVVPAP